MIALRENGSRCQSSRWREECMLAVIFLAELSSSSWIIKTRSILVNTFLMLLYPPSAVGEWAGQSSLGEREGRGCHWGRAERPAFLLWGGMASMVPNWGAVVVEGLWSPGFGCKYLKCLPFSCVPASLLGPGAVRG